MIHSVAGHDGVVQRDLSLGSLLEIQIVGAKDAGDLLHRGFRFAVGCWIVCLDVLS